MAATSGVFSNPLRPPSAMTARAGKRVRAFLYRGQKFAGWGVLALPALAAGVAVLFFGYFAETQCRAGRRYDDGCIAGWVAAYMVIALVLALAWASFLAYGSAQWAARRRRHKAERLLSQAALPFKTAYLRGVIDENSYRSILQRLKEQLRDEGMDHSWLFAGQFLLRLSLLVFIAAAGSVVGAGTFSWVLRREPEALPIFLAFIALAVVSTIIASLALAYGAGLRRAGARSRRAFLKEVRQLTKVLAQGGQISSGTDATAPAPLPPPPRLDLADPWRAP